MCACSSHIMCACVHWGPTSLIESCAHGVLRSGFSDLIYDRLTCAHGVLRSGLCDLIYDRLTLRFQDNCLYCFFLWSTVFVFVV